MPAKPRLLRGCGLRGGRGRARPRGERERQRQEGEKPYNRRNPITRAAPAQSSIRAVLKIPLPSCKIDEGRSPSEQPGRLQPTGCNLGAGSLPLAPAQLPGCRAANPEGTAGLLRVPEMLPMGTPHISPSVSRLGMASFPPSFWELGVEGSFPPSPEDGGCRGYGEPTAWGGGEPGHGCWGLYVSAALCSSRINLWHQLGRGRELSWKAWRQKGLQG